MQMNKMSLNQVIESISKGHHTTATIRVLTLTAMAAAAVGQKACSISLLHQRGSRDQRNLKHCRRELAKFEKDMTSLAEAEDEAQNLFKKMKGEKLPKSRGNRRKTFRVNGTIVAAPYAIVLRSLKILETLSETYTTVSSTIKSDFLIACMLTKAVAQGAAAEMERQIGVIPDLTLRQRLIDLRIEALARLDLLTDWIE